MSDETTGLSKFDPKPYLMKLQGKDYLPVSARLLWIRTVQPDAVIVTELIAHTDKQAVFRAQVSVPSGGSATGYGSETPGDFRDYLEKAECLSTDAEMLTRRGFVRHDALVIGEDVLAYDVATDTCHWTPLREVKVYRDRAVVRMHGRDMDVTMTADHRWATMGTYTSWITGESPRRMRPANEMTTSDRIILAAPAGDGASTITPDEAAVIGWLVTDGTIWRANGDLRPMIYQSKQHTVGRVRELVGTVAREAVGEPTTRTFPSGRTYDCLPQHVFHLPVSVVRPLLERAGLGSYHDLPRFVTTLSAAARRAMREAMMDADGDARGYFGKIAKPGVVEAWQILCTLDGIAVGMTRTGGAIPVQRAKQRRFASVEALRTEDAGTADVWCPTTDAGTWITRLPNGAVTITGNTKALGRALGALGYGTQFSHDFEDGHTAGRPVDSPIAYGNGNGQGTNPPPGAGATYAAAPANSTLEATPRQHAYLKRLQRESGWSASDVELYAAKVYGKTVIELSRGELSTFIDTLQASGSQLTSESPMAYPSAAALLFAEHDIDVGDPAQPALRASADDAPTEEQKRERNRLATALGMSANDLKAYMDVFFDGASSGTAADADRLIEQLERELAVRNEGVIG